MKTLKYSKLLRKPHNRCERAIYKKQIAICKRVFLLIEDIETLKSESEDAIIKKRFFGAIDSSLECLKEVRKKLIKNRDIMEQNVYDLGYYHEEK